MAAARPCAVFSPVKKARLFWVCAGSLQSGRNKDKMDPPDIIVHLDSAQCVSHFRLQDLLVWNR